MALPRVRIRDPDGVDEYDEILVVEGVGEIPWDENVDSFIGPVEVISEAGLTNLRNALTKRWGAFPPPPRTITHPDTGATITLGGGPSPTRCEIRLVDVPAAKFCERHSYEFMPEPVDLVYRVGGYLAVRVQWVIEGEDEPNLAPIRAILDPLLKRQDSVLQEIDCEPQGAESFQARYLVTNADFWVLTAYVVPPTHGRDVGSALKIGHEILALVEAADRGALTPTSAELLIDAGRADLLVGQHESSWLECKGAPYPETPVGRLELAKDVAGLANTASGGVIVLGLRTRSQAGRDLISGVRPIRHVERLPDVYRKWLLHYLHPVPESVSVRAALTESGDGGLLIVSVPAQPPALQPFLVRGTIVDDTLLGSYVSVYMRRGDAVISSSPEELHSLIVAGRAALGYRHEPA